MGNIEIKYCKTSLAKGIETDSYAKNCRVALRDIRKKEKKSPVSNDKKPQIKTEYKPKKDILSTPGYITVADIARELKIEPSLARAKMRKHENKVDHLRDNNCNERWKFPASAREQIIQIIKGVK